MQGSSFSPYLFVLAVNELSLNLQNALRANDLTCIVLGPNYPPVHSLMFTDDLIICRKTNMHEVQTISNILNPFFHDLGQIHN